MCVRVCSYSWFLMELLWLIKELTKFCSVFYITHSCLFIGDEWRLRFYNYSASVYIMIVSNPITSLNLTFLGRVDFTVGFWIFIFIGFTLDFFSFPWLEKSLSIFWKESCGNRSSSNSPLYKLTRGLRLIT